MLGRVSIGSTQIYTSLDFQHLAQAYDQAHPQSETGKSIIMQAKLILAPGKEHAPSARTSLDFLWSRKKFFWKNGCGLYGNNTIG
jgi:hypothetical protein